MGLLTPPEVRAALRPELQKRFHVVVGNPPYITEKDARRRDYHRAKIGKNRRYLSAAGRYSLGAPFTERMLRLSVDGGHVGEITADSFMKRKFGKALITQVLCRKDLMKVVATSGAYIPGHGTPTVILLARNRRPQADAVRVIMSKRGEPGRPVNPSQGKVWSSIMRGHASPGFDSEFISVADVDRATMALHPWSIGGGGAAELKLTLDHTASGRISEIGVVGVGGMSNADDAYIQEGQSLSRLGVAPEFIRPLVVGEEIRDWAHSSQLKVFFPYDRDLHLVRPQGRTLAAIWPYRTTLWARAVFGGGDYRAAQRPWFEWHQVTTDRYATPLSILFAFKATHNHFILDRGGKVFKQTAPVIKLTSADEHQHFVLLAQLNSSVGNFWIRQVCYPTGGDKTGDGARVTGEPWEERLERDGGKLGTFPVVSKSHPALQVFGRALDKASTERLEDAVLVILASHSSAGAAAVQGALVARRSRDMQRLVRMVGLQEELDWLCYHLYGLDPEGQTRTAEEVVPIPPGHRAFEFTLAQEDAERCEAVASGEEPDEAPTHWFSRHGWEPCTTLDALPESERAIVQARIERTQASRELSLLERPTYKHRWYKPDYEKEEHEVMELWLDDRLEAWGKERSEPFTAAQAGAALRADPGILAVGELLTGRADFDVDALIEERLRLAAVPNNKHHFFKPEGLMKRAGWEKTWEEQHKEDRGEPANPEVPEKYNDKDYLKKEYWYLRGKLDVPKERFVAFTEVPPPTGADTLYGWAGWTPRERAKAMLSLDEKLEAAGVSVADRHGLLYGVWFLLPYVAWESPEAASDFRADVRSLVGENGVTEAMLDEWAKRSPPPRGGKPAQAKTPKAAKRAKAKERAEP